MKRSGTLTFGLFVIVVLAAVFWLMHGRGQTQWGLVAVLLGILVLRVVLFVINLRQQRRNAERGRGSVNIETRLGLNDEEQAADQASGPPSEPPAASPGAPRP
jgi:Na+/melibiose symporter-like transporter